MVVNRNIFNIAFKQLAHKRRQTLLTVTGIAISVMVLISAISLMDGLLQSFISKIIDSAPHIIVSGNLINNPVSDLLYAKRPSETVLFFKNTERDDQEVIKNFTRIESIIKTDPNITLVSPVTAINVIAKFGIISQPITVLGIIPAKADAITKFSMNMTEGNFNELEKSTDAIIIGSSAAKDFKIKAGDRINLVSSSGSIFPVNVAGIFSTGINDVDNNAYVNLRLAQNIGGYSLNEVTHLYLRSNNLNKISESSSAIMKKTNYEAKTWEENAASLISLYKTISSMVYFLVFFVLLVAGFGVANILITNVLEKYRDIAILKSIGYGNSDITAIYIIQGMIVAMSGAIIGCVFGFVIIQILSSIPITPSQTSAIRSDHLEMGKSPYYFLLTSLFAMVVSFFASIGPARSASKVNPVEILRGER